MNKLLMFLAFVLLVLAIDVAFTERAIAQTPAATVQVPVNAAPPTWATDLLTTVEGLPVVGPIAGQVLLYLGILSAILTTLVATALSILSLTSGIAGFTGNASLVAKITAFKNGKIMYWLMYLSNFNAQKPTV